MTHSEFKNVVEALDIKYIQVIVKVGDQFPKFKDLDLFSDHQDFMEEVEEYIDDYMEPEDAHRDSMVIYLDPNNDFTPMQYQGLFAESEFCSDFLFSQSKTEVFSINRIVITFDKFIDLIS